MASFRTHICFGIALGFLGSLAIFTATISEAPAFLIAIFALATLGSVLPDFDSDTSIPFHVAFGSLAIVGAVLTFVALEDKLSGDWQSLLLSTAGVGIFIWGIVGYIVKRITRHRGMAHSIPVAVLSGLITFFIASHYSFADTDAFLLGLAMTGGYMIHLILDEVFAAVNFHGHTHLPNKAFGTALKLRSHSSAINIAVYGAIGLLLAGNTQRLWNVAVTVWAKFS